MDEHKGRKMPSYNGHSKKSRSPPVSSSKKRLSRSQSLEEFDQKKKLHESRSAKSSCEKQKAHGYGSPDYSSRKRKSSRSSSPEEYSHKKLSHHSKSPPRLSSSVESTMLSSPVQLHEKKTKKYSDSEPLDKKQVRGEKGCMWSSSGKWAIQKSNADSGDVSTSVGNLDSQVTNSLEKLEKKERFRSRSLNGQLFIRFSQSSVPACNGELHTNKFQPKEDTNTVEAQTVKSSSGKWHVLKSNLHLFDSNNQETQKIVTSLRTHKSSEVKQKLKTENRVFPLSDETQQLVILAHPEKITIKGKVRIRCLCGQVSIFGYHIKSADRIYDVYSPDSHSLVSIETMDSYQGNVVQSVDLLAAIEGSDYLEEIMGFLNCFQYPVILLLEELNKPYLNFISSLKTFKTLFLLDSQLQHGYHVKTLKKIGAQLCGTKSDVSQLLSTEEFSKINKWIDQNLSNESPPVILVCGGKSVGKSTLTRYLINTLLNRVEQIAYLECDVGQTEFTPGCCVSVTIVREPLFGPPFSHQQKPLCCCFLGVLSPAHNPEAYINCVTFVHKNFLESNIRCPLVVNTMGWNKGIGLALLTDILRLVKPDLVIQINSRHRYKNVPDVTLEFISEQPGWISPFIDPEDVKQHSLIIVESAVDKLPCHHDQYKPADHRSLSLLSCLGHLLVDAKHGLNAITPYVLPWQQVAVHLCHAAVPASQVMYSLNASVVALCTVDESKMVNTDIEGYPKFLRVNPVCPCLGFGVIRGIDPVEKVFYLLSSLSLEEISKVNCLLLGALRIPEILLLHQKYPVVPYIGHSKSVVGSKSITKRKHVWKRNYPVRW